MSKAGRHTISKLKVYNDAKQLTASGRWKMLLELSKTHSRAEIVALTGLSRQRVSQLLIKARMYFENGTSP